MIFSTDPEKASESVQRDFMIKVLKEMGTDGIYIHIRELCTRKIANIILNGEI